MCDFPPAQRIRSNGITLSVHLSGPEAGLPVLLLHGWPELARSWKNQVKPLAAAGFRIIAPDLRGFGGSDAPGDVAAYGIDTIIADMTGLLDALGHERAVWAGHDWGGLIVWPAAVLVPDRVAGVIGVNTPHLPRPPLSPLDLLVQRFGEDHYFNRFQQEGLAESLFEGREDDFFAFIFTRLPGRLPAQSQAEMTHLLKLFAAFDPAHVQESRIAVPAAERAHYAAAYKKSGFRGGINYYRNVTANWRRMAGVDLTVRQPALMIGAEHDPYLPPVFMDGMEERVPDLQKHIIKGCGHWTQWEAPDELTALMIAWLRQRLLDLGSGT